MEDLKQEAIKKSFGKFLEYFESMLYDDNGDAIFNDEDFAGIENNNGWIRILEDGSNLPKEYCSCWVMIDDVIINTPAYFNPFSQTFTDNLVQQYYTRFTYYQKIESPKPPIY